MAIDTVKFVNKLVEKGYTHLCVVPCSFVKYLINEAINCSQIEYVPCASESVVCSISAGLKMAGKNPIAIIQSSGLTNMGSCITSLLKPYNITFPILTSWRTYKIGDSEIQHQHLATELPNLIHAYGYNYELINVVDIDVALSQLDKFNVSHTIGVILKDTFTAVKLQEKHKLDLTCYSVRSKYLLILNDLFKESDTIFIGTTGNTAREMYSFMPKTKNFYMAGNMGGALSLGLGASIAGKKVVVCGGDAEFVMHMGGLTTAGRYLKGIKLLYILFDNQSNKSTGGQRTYQEHVNYIQIAKNSGFNVHEEIIIDTDTFKNIISSIIEFDEINFIHVKCDFDDETSRPPFEKIKINSFNEISNSI